MAIDERRRLELADAVKRTLGDEAGLTLMEMLPPVGWADVATKQDLDALRAATKGDVDGLRAATKQDLDGLRAATRRDLDALRSEMHHQFGVVDQRFEALEHKLLGAFHKEMTAQTWRLVTAATAMFGLFAAVVRL